MTLKRFFLLLMAALAVFACTPGASLEDGSEPEEEQTDPNEGTEEPDGPSHPDDPQEQDDHGHGQGDGQGDTQTITQPGWFELPAMDMVKSGNYLVSASDNSLYYAMHICPDIYGPGGSNARNYTVCFDSEKHCPLWVAAPLHSMYKKQGRHEAYQPDPDIPSDCQWKATKNATGFTKGHMLGSGDRNKTENTNHQVFYYSNIAPQLAYDSNEQGGFNTGGGGWNTLEEWVDTKLCSDTLYVVIGCYFLPFGDVYHSGTTIQPEILSGWGRTDVANPTMFYYILLRTKNGNTGKSIRDCTREELQCAVFARAHTVKLHKQKVTSMEMMSVSDLEKLTGVTYFANVPQAPKDTFTASDWGL